MVFMASIRTSIQIQDGFSNALRSMNTALNYCISSFEAVHRASNNGIDAGQFSFARAELNKVGASLAKVEEDIMRANQSQQQFNTTMQNTNSIADKLLRLLWHLPASLCRSNTQSRTSPHRRRKYTPR